MISIIRYPGSKAKLWKHIREALPFVATAPLWNTELGCYCEPFFGSGAIGWRLLPGVAQGNRNARIILADLDPWLVALWKSVRDVPRDLIRKVLEFKPNVEAFYQFKDEDGRLDIDPLLQGFRKLALHRMSHSGFGFMSGGPLGGADQASAYKVGCRWTPHSIVADIQTAHRQLTAFRRPVEIVCKDFADTFNMVPPRESSVVYLDPPYYVQGENLYKHAMEEADHVRLADALRAARFRWLLSYDDHQRIRDLYSFATVTEFSMTPTCATTKAERRKNNELLIRNY